MPARAERAPSAGSEGAAWSDREHARSASRDKGKRPSRGIPSRRVRRSARVRRAPARGPRAPARRWSRGTERREQERARSRGAERSEAQDGRFRKHTDRELRGHAALGLPARRARRVARCVRRASARGARAPAGARVERGSGARGAAHRTREEEEKSTTACAVLARLRQREPPATHNCRPRVIRRDARWRGLTPHEAASEEDARHGQPATGLEKERRAPQCATSLLDCGGENHRACATRRQCACASASIDRYGRSTPLNGSKKNCNRRAADDDPSDAEGRDGGSAVRGKRGPLARSTTRNERERAAQWQQEEL